MIGDFERQILGATLTRLSGSSIRIISVSRNTLETAHYKTPRFWVYRTSRFYFCACDSFSRCRGLIHDDHNSCGSITVALWLWVLGHIYVNTESNLTNYGSNKPHGKLKSDP